ncbi:MAG: precorrin-2 C(20)-methyltransferase [Firmicutes bacterium HGW-Firmicutes-1]|jgi:precorrin-2/cobalt-factor-2 C20-methyltransferase|nr:MAG: precorrin-2 C(20)-methyltransferase [Firmicutes bacterium HGW-Firmicutes-1]
MSKFYGIGVGPGDPELLTIKAARVLGSIDVLLIPQTQKDKKGVAYTIMEQFLRKNIEVVYIDFPMVADEETFVDAGKQAANIIISQTKLGKSSAFVTLGDPSVYSTYGYIVKALEGKVEIETIPGITSFCAAAALANRPLVEKDEILTIVPMNASDERIDAALKVGDAFAFMKIYKREERVANHLMKHYMEEDGILVQRCGFKEAIVHTDVIESLHENTDYLTLVLSRKEEVV